VASLSQGRTAAAQCGLFTYKSVPVIFEPPCILKTAVLVYLIVQLHASQMLVSNFTWNTIKCSEVDETHVTALMTDSKKGRSQACCLL